MTSQTFDISPSSGGGAQVQDSASAAVGAGESVRVRFSELTGGAEALLAITANAVTTYVPITDSAAWVTGAVAEGDVVAVRVYLRNSIVARATGILETFS